MTIEICTNYCAQVEECIPDCDCYCLDCTNIEPEPEITCEMGTCEYTGDELFTLPFISHQTGFSAQCVRLNMCDQCYDMTVNEITPRTYCKACHPYNGCAECAALPDGFVGMCYDIE